MSITLTINADNPQDLRRKLADLLGTASNPLAQATDLSVAGASAASADPKPAATRRSTKGATSSEAPSSAAGDAGNGSAPAAEQNAGSQSAGNAGTTGSTTEAITRDAVRALGGQYGGVAGATALQELFKELGSANGKLSEVTDDKLPALHARLSDLLAAQS